MRDAVTAPTRRERGKADTDREIRQHARALLIEQGWEAVTLRAIARKIGITAPALYRYYTSREDLIQHIRTDICTELADELYADLAEVPEDDILGQVLTVCRSFRLWSIGHPREFSLIFASPDEPTGSLERPAYTRLLAADPFGQIFLAAIGRVLATTTLTAAPDDSAPADLRGELEALRSSLGAVIADTGFDVSEQVLSLGTTYAIVKFWVGLFGQIALEVMGRLPFAVAKPEALFEALLADLVHQVGLV